MVLFRMSNRTKDILLVAVMMEARGNAGRPQRGGQARDGCCRQSSRRDPRAPDVGQREMSVVRRRVACLASGGVAGLLVACVPHGHTHGGASPPWRPEPCCLWCFFNCAAFFRVLGFCVHPKP
jgi:hypothetical protein